MSICNETERGPTSGTVTVYVDGASGAVSGAAVTACQDAVETWSTPLCITPTVESTSAATPVAPVAGIGHYEEVWCQWWSCSRCSEDVMGRYSFCPGCGASLDWSGAENY